MLRKLLLKIHPTQSFLIRIGVACWLVILLDTRSFAAAPSNTSRENRPCCGADVWLVNTRRLSRPCGRCGINANLPMRRLKECRWKKSGVEEFVSTLTPETIVCVHIDGNRIDGQEAIQRGLRFKRRLGCCEKTVRFVIWSWPSDTVTRRFLKDARIKICRADQESYFLASWLTQMPSEQPVSVLGYSLGARTVTGGLHLLGGGRFCGNQLDVDSDSYVRPRVVLLGATVPLHWICANGRNGLAMQQSDRVLSVFNSKDQVLKFFRLASGNKNEIVLGYRGVNKNCLLENAYKLKQCNIFPASKRSHDIDDYTGPHILGSIRQYALWQPVH